MCYSALVHEDWRQFVKRTGASISLPAFYELFVHRNAEPTEYRIPRGFEREFAHPQSDEERAIKALVDEYHARQTSKLETELFSQRKRLADAERKLAMKETKSATESKRIAGTKVEQILGKLSLLKDDRPHANDYRIFPRTYAPILLSPAGSKLLMPARYLLRQPDAPAFMDDKLSGNYNARRDNLTRFWRRQFGISHAILPITSFFENVTDSAGAKHVLHFNPQPAGTMFIACLYSEWKDLTSGKSLLSFAAVTDEPPPEVAAAGHNRIVINLTPQASERWLTPQGRSDDELQLILDERQRPHYEYEIAA